MATSCPILMLNNPSKKNPRFTYHNFAAGMAARSNVRSTLINRNVSFPNPENPATVAQTIHAIVHEDITPAEAIALTIGRRDRAMDALTRFIS